MKLHWVLTVAAATILAAAAASAQQPIVIKFSHVVAVDTPKGKGAEYFKKLAEERTKGRVKVEVYPNSSLFKDGEEMEALQLGSVQMLAPSVAKFGPLGVREFEVFDLPYIFDNYEELHKVTGGNVAALLFKKLESKGIVGLAYWDNGFKDISANKPLHLPADYKGLKMRIQSSKVLGDEIKALGAIPQVMAFSEVYQGLQTGVVDGTENPPSNFYTQKMQEVQKYLALTDHGVIGYAVIVEQEVLGRAAAGHPHDARGRDEGRDQVRQRHRAEGERRRAGGGPEDRQDRDHQAHAGREGRDEEGARPGAQGERVAHRQGHHRRGLQGDGVQTVGPNPAAANSTGAAHFCCVQRDVLRAG